MAELHVSGGGSNLQAAILEANDGDRLIVADGVYDGCLVLPEFAGLEIQSENGPRNCIIDASRCTGLPEGTKLWEYDITPENPMTYHGNHTGFYDSRPCVYRPCPTAKDGRINACTIRGFTLTGAFTRRRYYTNNDGKRCWEGLDACAVFGSKVNVDRCVIRNCTGQVSIVRCAPGPWVDYCTISNSTIHDCNVGPVYMGQTDGNEDGMFYAYRMVNCLVYNLRNFNGTLTGFGATGISNRGTIHNCTFDVTSALNVARGFPGSANHVFRNIASTCPLTRNWVESYRRGTVYNCAISGDRIDALNENSEIEEQYRNRIVVLGEDFKLDRNHRPLPGSPLIGAGYSSTYSPKDAAGKLWRNPPSIGCYEFDPSLYCNVPTRMHPFGLKSAGELPTP